MNPLSQSDVEIILQQLEFLVAGLKENPQLVDFYTFFAFMDRIYQGKKPQLELSQVERFIVLLEEICFIKRKSFSQLNSSYRSMRDIVEILDSEVNTLSTFYNSIRPEVFKVRKVLFEECKSSFKDKVGKNLQDYSCKDMNRVEAGAISMFWDSSLKSSLNGFREARTIDSLDSVIACLPKWVTSSCNRMVTVRGERKEVTSIQLNELINQYLNICDEFIDQIKDVASSSLKNLSSIDPKKLQKEIELRDSQFVSQLKQSISEMKASKDLSKAEKSKLKEEKDKLQFKLDSVIKGQKQEIDEQVHEEKKQRDKLLSLEKRAKSYRENFVLRVERQVIKTLYYLVSTYDLQREKDPTWFIAKKQMRKFFIQQISDPTN